MRKAKRLHLRPPYILDIKKKFNSHLEQVFYTSVNVVKKISHRHSPGLIQADKPLQVHSRVLGMILTMTVLLSAVSHPRYHDYMESIAESLYTMVPRWTRKLAFLTHRKRTEICLLNLLLCFKKTLYPLVKYSLRSHWLLLPTVGVAVV